MGAWTSPGAGSPCHPSASCKPLLGGDGEWGVVVPRVGVMLGRAVGMVLDVQEHPVLLPVPLTHLLWMLVFCCWGRMEPRQVLLWSSTVGWVVGALLPQFPH